jgi:hypothetical protein
MTVAEIDGKEAYSLGLRIGSRLVRRIVLTEIRDALLKHGRPHGAKAVRAYQARIVEISVDEALGYEMAHFRQTREFARIQARIDADARRSENLWVSYERGVARGTLIEARRIVEGQIK